MKKYIFIYLALLGIGNHAAAQNDPFEVQMRAYQNALKYYDLQAATISVYNMQALKPERKDMLDSLALLYFAGERYPQAYLVGEEILRMNPARTDMLELVAVSKQNLNMTKEALADYEKLYEKDKSLYHLYQISTLQYALKRFGECVASVDKIVADPKSAETKINLRNQNNSSQDVPMNAAAYNVKGICALELNQPEAAKTFFNKAIELFPDFVLAKTNLQQMTARETAKNTEKKPTAAPAPAPKK